MIRVIEAIVILGLLLCAFFLGVKYSDQVKDRAGWLFETKEEEVELPAISSEGAVEVEIPAENNSYNNQQTQEVIIEDDNSSNQNNSSNLNTTNSSSQESNPVKK